MEACCRVATIKISKFNALPLVPVSLAFQHNSPLRQKKQGYERFTSFQHCKKAGQLHHWAHFLTNRMGCSLMTIEKNAGKMQRNRFLHNGAFFGRSKHASKIHIQEKRKTEHPGWVYLRTKWRGDEKTWLMHTAPPFCQEKKSLAPNHSVGFSRDPAFYSYKVWALTCWGEFHGGYVYMYI